MAAAVQIVPISAGRIHRAAREGLEPDAALHLVAVGDEVDAADPTILRGHGTRETAGRLTATLAGVVQRVDRLVLVAPLAARYGAEVGDVVVGRVTEVGPRRWRVALQAKAEAVLMLSAVDLGGGAQRKRTAEDELAMRDVYKEGDLLAAEVQALHADGTVVLHTRGGAGSGARAGRYGALGAGALVVVPPALVRRQKRHFVEAGPARVPLVLGCNGAVWVRSGGGSGGAAAGGGGAAEAGGAPAAAAPTREDEARAAQAVAALGRAGFPLTPASIGAAIELALARRVAPADMLGEAFMVSLVAAQRGGALAGGGGGGL